MARATLDHLVVAAERLEDGIDHVERCLGVRPHPGGQHPDLGTHNALLRLGPSIYLEVIAIDPDGAVPEVARWFDLDGEATRHALAERPRLLTWVARSDDLDTLLTQCLHDSGEARRMRRGEMTWRIAFPADGHLVEGGLVPPLIEWDPGMTHPAERLPDDGLTLIALHGVHPHPDDVRDRLAPLGLEGDLHLEDGEPGTAPTLQARIGTREGERWID